MKFGVIFRILGVLLMIFSLTMLPPIPVSFWFNDSSASAFMLAFILTFINGLLLWVPFRNQRRELNVRDGFLIVVLFWTVLSLYGSLPFLLIVSPQIDFTDAIFESISGLTTTGASVLSNLDSLPNSLRYYRQQLQFLGGMGIIVLAVAILPMLGIGGMELYRAETPGPLKDSKLTPRIQMTAKILWVIYLILTAACAGVYWLCGMSLFDAIGESFATVSTGGFSLHDSSFGYYDSIPINIAAIFFMIIGATNFGLHYLAWQRRSLRSYFEDTEFKVYLLILVGIILLIIAGLLWHQVYNNPTDALLNAVFNVVSMLTTTGYFNNSFGAWPSYLPFLIMFSAFIGGCAGSTAGGMKVIRFMLLNKQSYREIRRLIHPHAILPIKFGGKILNESMVQAIWGFISAYGGLFIILLLILLALGLDIITALGALTACLANAGAGMGQTAETFAHLNSQVKWVLSFAMIVGRLEVFTVLVILLPEFWRS